MVAPSRVRLALLDEIPVLARHHREMFQDIWMQSNQSLDALTAQAIEVAYQNKLAQQMPQGVCRSWVGEQGRIVASGALTTVSFVPVPGDNNHQVAYIHTIFTEKDFRGHGWASRIVQAILDDCKNRGIKRLLLNASDQGRPVYERFGFQPTSKMMHLMVE